MKSVVCNEYQKILPACLKNEKKASKATAVWLRIASAAPNFSPGIIKTGSDSSVSTRGLYIPQTQNPVKDSNIEKAFAAQQHNKVYNRWIRKYRCVCSKRHL